MICKDTLNLNRLRKRKIILKEVVSLFRKYYHVKGGDKRQAGECLANLKKINFLQFTLLLLIKGGCNA